MAGKVKSICEEKVVPLIQQMGFDCIEVEYVKQADGMNLTFYIDSDNGVTIDDCENVSKAIDPVLDQLNPTDDKPYILSVSSPGLDRPLKSARDFNRNLDKKVELTLFSKLDGKKVYSGILKKFDSDTVTIETENGEKLFERKLIANIVPIITFD